MSQMPPGDPYVENVLRNLPDEVARTLTAEQVDGFREAMRRTRRKARHIVDLRLLIPLYFARFYCVFIFGKDRRAAVRQVLHERRRQAGLLGLAVFLAIAFLALAGLTFTILYVVKSAADINLFPGHLSDWLP